MKNKVKNRSIYIIIAGFMVIAAILVIGTLGLGRVAGRDTRAAVRNVSLLYLSELAGRRERVVSSAFESYIRDLDVAVGMLEKDDLASSDNLRAYQFRMKQLYDLDKFAFIDTKGFIYTSRGIRSDIDQYKLDYLNLSEPEILIKNLHSSDKKVVIAIPVDHLKFGNETLVACFMEIDMDVLLRNVSMQSNNNTTFCNIYTSEGVALTDMVLGGLASEDNLLEALERAEYEKGYSYEKVAEDFAENRSGEVSFAYNGISETLYYVPIQGTRWMLTYLIRESVIEEQINSISQSIILRSVIQSVLTAFVMIALFVIFLIQQKKSAREALEREVNEAENRIRQQELEEQLAMQEELASKSEELSQALDAAENANRAKSNFVSNMSHEIRTPITAILGMNEMIRRESDNENIRSYADNISNAGESLLGIISDILDFSKIEAGRMELNARRYSTRELIGGLYNMICIRTEAKGLNLVFNIDRRIPAGLMGDEIRLKQIITNLLTNAVKYTEKGDITLSITCGEKDEAGQRVRLMVSVSDTGIGIRAEEMDKLFTPFDRLDVTRTRNIEGTGLGLSISRQLLHMMDSELMVESIYGKGSRFYFSLWQGLWDPEEMGEFRPEDRIRVAREEERNYFTAPGRKVLVVDDMPINLQVLKGLLKRTGMIIDTASGGPECIQCLGKKDYDIVFMDYRMPGMNGIETLHKLHELYPEKMKRIPVIALTASAVLGDKEKLLKEGFTEYLTKPVIISDMEEVMRRYVGVTSAEGMTEPEGKGAEDKSGIVSYGGSEEGRQEARRDAQGDAQGDAHRQVSAGGFEDVSGDVPEEIREIRELEPERGLDYCGDAEDYLFALHTFGESVEEKASAIEAALKEERIEDYLLLVHSLKSISKSIGAMGLSEEAAALERQGRDGSGEARFTGAADFVERYRALGAKLNSLECLKSIE